MLQVNPKNINPNFLPINALLTWPNTQGIHFSFASAGGQLYPIVDSAAVLVEDNVETAAILSELNKKDGMVQVQISGYPDEGDIYVYHSFEHPNGTVLMCLGIGSKDFQRHALEVFTKQIWPVSELEED